MTPVSALENARSHRKQFVTDLKEFLRFPSVSAQPGHELDVRECANWLAHHLRYIGLDEVVVVPTSGHPIVYGQCTGGGDLPTILIYGHYDVQPADGTDGWHSPPFTPTLRDGAICARGASDDKGQMFAHVKALQSYLATSGRLPVNVKCIFEGEEETGSKHLGFFLDKNRDALRCDAAVVSDAQMESQRPAITYALRGSLTGELEVLGPTQDLHSGLFGGAVDNPLRAMAEIIARLYTRDGRVAIPGFYTRVRVPFPEERLRMARMGASDEQLCRNAGVTQSWGERQFSLYERTTIRPALTINGISGGYQGTGDKGVIPSRAVAKLSFRLVPDQDAAEIEQLFRRCIAHITPSTVRSVISIHSKAKPVVIDRRHPAVRAGLAACARGFEAVPVLVRNGGTVPVVSMLKEKLGVPTVLMGFASPDDHLHGPDESFRLINFYRGIETAIWFIAFAANALLQQDVASAREEAV